MIKHLLSEGFDITVLTRDAAKTKDMFPQGLSIAQVDYDSGESLVKAIQGHDVVASTQNRDVVEEQIKLIDATIAAGIPRMFISNYGNDTTDDAPRHLPFVEGKYKVYDYVREKAKQGVLTWTSIATGPFLDMLLAAGMVFHGKERKVDLYDGGNTPFSTTLTEGTGIATAAALRKPPKETENRMLKVHSAVITQNQLLKLGKELTRGKEWTGVPKDTKEIEKKSFEAWNKGERQMPVLYGFLERAVFGEGFGSKFENDDSASLGVKQMSESDLKAFLATLV